MLMVFPLPRLVFLPSIKYFGPLTTKHLTIIMIITSPCCPPLLWGEHIHPMAESLLQTLSPYMYTPHKKICDLYFIIFPYMFCS